LRPYLSTAARFEHFGDFIVAEGLAASPELRQLDAAIAAQQRLVASRRRALYLPRVQLNGELSYQAYREQAGAAPALPGGTTFELPQAPDLQWFVGVGLSLPLFTGLEQTADKQEAIHRLRELELQRRSARLTVEQGIRSALAGTHAAAATIEFAEQAAAAARKNLEVVTDAYARGAVDTVTLLDAQNNALIAGQAEATAVFDYLKAVVGLQRSLGRFELFNAAGARDAWFERLRRHFATLDEG
jgi:outer membrane protein TolC